MLPENQKSRYSRLLPTMEILVLASLAFLVILVMRVGFHLSPVLLILETLFYVSLPFFLLRFFAEKIVHESNAGRQNRVVYRIQLGAILIAITPMLCQSLTRIFGVGESLETVLFTMLMYSTWFLTVFSRIGSLERVSFMMSSSLILFTCFKCPSILIYALVSIYSVVALWWLFGQYWSRLESKSIDEHQRNLTLRSATLLGSVLLLMTMSAALLAFSPLRQSVSLKGFMPFSGGSSWQDAYGRSGIGDGEMLTAGANATTTGAVDSDEFIEDDKPSMYDVLSESLSPPMKIKKRKNRAVALAGFAKHLNDVIQSEQKGQTFRTVRRPPDKNDIKLSERRSDALFFVEGSVPARFAIDRFQHFDGWDWTHADLSSDEVVSSRGSRITPITMEKRFGTPWFVIQNVERKYLPYHRAHRVKMMKLETDTLPSPALLKRWHIHRVEMEDFFCWNEHEMVTMRGEPIPTHTTIDMISMVPNYHVLRNSRNLQSIDDFQGVGTEYGTSVNTFDPREPDSENPFIQIPDNESTSRVISIAKEWSSGHAPGWNQVEAIVNRLRNDFQHDPSMVASQDGIDSVGCFLDQKGGPSYLFATTATQLLRAAGYRTRIARGFLVQSEDFDRFANQSIVTSDNVHLWPEVCLDGWHWIPLEPTPGYPIPFSNQTFFQWVQSGFAMAMAWIKNHPIGLGSMILIMFLSHRFRRELVAFGSNILWLLAFPALPSRRLKTTRQLIDIRFWAARHPRPAFAPISGWFSRVDSNATNDFVHYWQRQYFCSLNHSSKRDVNAACRRAATGLTLPKIKEYTRQFNLQDSP